MVEPRLSAFLPRAPEGVALDEAAALVELTRRRPTRSYRSHENYRLPGLS